MKKRLSIRKGTLALFCFLGLTAGATTFTWTGGGDGMRWEDENNWDPVGLPTSSDDVTISSGTVKVRDTLAAGSLTIGSGATVYFGSSGTAVSEAYMAYPDAATSRVFRVTGNLSVAGNLALGGRGRYQTNHESYVEISNLVISVGGDFSISEGARVAIYAAPVPHHLFYNLNGTANYPATFSNIWSSATCVAVTGALSVGGTSVVYSENDAMTGAPVVFKAASFTLAEGATVTAEGLGWSRCQYTDDDPMDSRASFSRSKLIWGQPPFFFTLAPITSSDSTSPTPRTYSVAASYGGKSRGYGYPYAPFLSGSPGDTYQGLSRGGGTVCVWVTGNMSVNGTMNAMAQAWSYWSAPASGSIWLLARKIEFGANSKLTARGVDDTNTGGGGCGGRISLGIGLTPAEVEKVAGGALPSDIGLSSIDSITAPSVDVHGGLLTTAGAYGQDGTATTVYGSMGDVSVTVQGSPVAATTVSPSYGAYTYSRGDTETFTATAAGQDPDDPTGVHYSCAGFVVSNATEEIVRGATRSFDLKLEETPLFVTWLWNDKSRAAHLTLDGHVAVTVNGTRLESSGTAFVSDGATATLTVEPEEGYEFLFWEGDVPYGKSTANPLVYTVGEVRNFHPVVRPNAAATTATWLGGTGCWSDPAKWDTGIVPNLSDDVVIAAGTCSVSNWFKAKSVTLSGSAKLQVALDASDLLSEGGGEIAGDLTISGTAKMSVVPWVDFKWYSVYLSPYNLICHCNLTVGGNLALADSAELYLTAGPLDGDSFTMAKGGGFLTVGGTLVLNGTSKLYPQCEPYTGAGVVIRANRFVLAAGAKVDATGKGWQLMGTRNPQTLAPGAGSGHAIGAGHGGRGNRSDKGIAQGGATYGFANAPVAPGSVSGYWGNTLGAGGGSIRIHAGSALVNGTLDATAAQPSNLGGASGGGIWLTTSRRLQIGPTAQFLAKGSKETTMNSNYLNDGGGGRIAIGRRLTDAQVAALAASGECEGVDLLEEDQFASDYPDVTVNVEAARAVYTQCKGTFRYVKGPQPGFAILVR